MIDPESLNIALASNLSQLRKKRKLSFDALSKLSGISKGTLVQIEKNDANPNIATLCKLANVFGVTLSQLVDEQKVLPSMSVISLEDATELWKGEPGSSAKLLFGVSDETVVEFWRWQLKPLQHHESEGHPRGAKEIIHVLSGELCVTAGEEQRKVITARTLQFNADTAHQYYNAGHEIADFIMVVMEPK